MTKEKLEKVIKYQALLKNRLEGKVPEKHKDHPNTFKQFLLRELKVVTSQLEEVRLAGIADKK